MLICPHNGPLNSMPLPIVSHQRNRYSVKKISGICYLQQHHVLFHWALCYRFSWIWVCRCFLKNNWSSKKSTRRVRFPVQQLAKGLIYRSGETSLITDTVNSRKKSKTGLPFCTICYETGIRLCRRKSTVIYSYVVLFWQLCYPGKPLWPLTATQSVRKFCPM